MRAICPGAYGDSFVNFPDGASDYELSRYGCRAAGDEEQPAPEDFVATGLVQLDTPPPLVPRMAEPNPPSFFFDTVALSGPVLAAPRPPLVPRIAEPDPPSWLAALGGFVSNAVSAVLPPAFVPRQAEPAPPLLSFGVVPFTDSGITQEPRPVDPVAVTQAAVSAVSTVIAYAAPPPVSWLAPLLDQVSTAVFGTARAVVAYAAPTPPVLLFPAPTAPELVNRPRPASAGSPVCLRLPDGGFVSVPPEYAGGYEGVPVDYAYCLGKTDPGPGTVGPGRGSNPVEIPVSGPPPLIPVVDPTPTPTPTTPIVSLPAIVDLFTQPLWFQAQPLEAAGPPAPEAVPSDETPSAATEAKPKSCCSACADHDAGGKRNWIWLLLAAFALYKLTK